MTKSQVTEMILQEVRKDIEQFMSEEDTITSSIEYEDRVIEICRSLGRKLIAGGDQVHKKGRNAKKTFNKFWLGGSFKEARTVQVHQEVWH